MKNYEELGVNNKLQSKTSLAHKDSESRVDNLNFDSFYDVQTNRLNSSKVNLGEFIKRSTDGTALGTFSASQALNLTSTITYISPKASNRTFGKPVIALYEGAGTDSADQIYPITGANVTLGRYDIVGGEVDYANYNGTSDQWRGMIIDTNGTSTQVVTLAASWIFADYVTDTAG